jgi:hypothetical protein
MNRRDFLRLASLAPVAAPFVAAQATAPAAAAGISGLAGASAEAVQWARGGVFKWRHVSDSDIMRALGASEIDITRMEIDRSIEGAKMAVGDLEAAGRGIEKTLSGLANGITRSIEFADKLITRSPTESDAPDSIADRSPPVTAQVGKGSASPASQLPLEKELSASQQQGGFVP